MTTIADKMLAIGAALEDGHLPYAFGGALALAFCTERARGTIDIDLNVFVTQDQARTVLEALPDGVVATDGDRRALDRDGQSRLWWDRTPVDLFLDTTEFHVEASQRRRFHEFAGRRLPFLGCSDLAVFKAFFDRKKDWLDIEEMIAIGACNVDQTIGVLVRYLGDDDGRVAKLRHLATPQG